MKAGRKTILDEDLFLKIKELYLDGKNMREISEILDIPYKTMEGWKLRNYEGFKDKMFQTRLERMFETSIEQIEVLQRSEDERVNMQVNLSMAESLGKQWFSKRTEMTGKDGKELKITFDSSFEK